GICLCLDRHIVHHFHTTARSHVRLLSGVQSGQGGAGSGGIAAFNCWGFGSDCYRDDVEISNGQLNSASR
ncbi:hypothetical protein PMAYCL1PPCAC_27547, partial [Pristionchus mayeri]